MTGDRCLRGRVCCLARVRSTRKRGGTDRGGVVSVPPAATAIVITVTEGVVELGVIRLVVLEHNVVRLDVNDRLAQQAVAHVCKQVSPRHVAGTE